MSGEVIPQIRDWGYRVCLLSEFPDDPGVAQCERYIRVNTFNPEACLQAAQILADEGWCFDAVLSLCWDCPVSVARIAQHFGLRSVSIEVAEQSTLKHIRIRLLRQAGIPVANFAVFEDGQLDATQLAQLRFPLVCKPVDLSGATGVQLITSASDLPRALQASRALAALSGSRALLLEEFLEGIEYSAEGLMLGSQLWITGLSERVFDTSARPSFVEIGDIMPTLLTPEQKSEVHTICEKAAAALGILEGVVKFDLILYQDRIHVLEVTPRLGGPRFGTEMIPLSNGTNILKAAIQHLLGEAVNTTLLQAQFERGMVAFSVFSPCGGTIRAIDGLDEIRNLQGFYDFKWWKGGGYRVGDRVTARKKLGYYIVQAATRDEALALAQAVEERIRIEVTP